MAQTVGPILGRGLKLFIDGVAVARITDNSLESSGNMVDISNKDSGRDSEFLSGRTSHTISAEAVFSFDLNSLEGYQSLFATFVAGTAVEAVVSNENAGDYEWTAATAFISGLPVTFPDDDKVTFSIELQVSGALTYTVIV